MFMSIYELLIVSKAPGTPGDDIYVINYCEYVIGLHAIYASYVYIGSIIIIAVATTVIIVIGICYVML